MPAPPSVPSRPKIPTYPVPLHMVPLTDSYPALRPPTSPTSSAYRRGDNTVTRSSSPMSNGNRPSFSFARDTKASIARAARSRHPSSNSDVSNGGRVVSPAGSRSATPIARLTGEGEREVRSPTPARAQSQTMARTNISAKTEIGEHPAPERTSPGKHQDTPRAQHRHQDHSHSAPSRSIPSYPTPSRSARARTPRPAPPSPLTPIPTPRFRPLPALPLPGSPTPKATRILRPGRPGSAMSFYDRLSSLTSSTRGTVGRANSAKVSKNAQPRNEGVRGDDTRGGRCSERLQGSHAGEDALDTANISHKRERPVTPRTVPTPTNTAPPVLDTAQTPTKPSSSGSWLKRMGSTHFARSAHRIASPCTSPRSRAKERIAYSPSTPVRREVGTNAMPAGGSSSPWISARTLAIEDPLPASSSAPSSAAALSMPHQSEPGRTDSGVGGSDSLLPALDATAPASPTPTRADIVKRHRTPSNAHLRDLEQEWKAALEVEVMSHAESECLARAECISVYDPWGDCPGQFERC